jgi:hypothetical protein
MFAAALTGCVLPQALDAGTFIAAPPAKVLGNGLGTLQIALEALKAGVSAEKIVVTLL